jgi:hypothetical protein
MTWKQRLNRSPFWIRLTHWEYWSFTAVYLPIYPIFVLLGLRARAIFFFAAANPRIRNGGFLCESKEEIYSLTPKNLQPKTIFFPQGADPATVWRQVELAGIGFPMIGKPNVGGRGRGIQKLVTPDDVQAYAQRASMDFHIQEFITLEKELGIFYFRFPGQERGRISGIVAKEFLSVTGDGQKTVHELMLEEPRAVLQIGRLASGKPALMKEIPAAGETRTLVPYGNHARGAKFIDATHLATPALSNTIDQICRQIPEFYFGRLDIRYKDQASLEAGTDFSIMEVNGAGSEPTHIYDPRHSYFFAWKEIIRHWVLLYKISRLNHRRGFPYLSFHEGRAMFREDKVWSAKLQLMASPEEEEAL